MKNKMTIVDKVLMKRQAFSWCGQLLGHFPVAGWLRPVCNYIKRTLACQEWDEEIPKGARMMLSEVASYVRVEDPMMGSWVVSRQRTGIVWSNTSSLAIEFVWRYMGTS